MRFAEKAAGPGESGSGSDSGENAEEADNVQVMKKQGQRKGWQCGG